VNFLADENVDKQIADGLRLMGHNVEYVAEKDAGISDDEVLEMANEKTALLLAADKDFANLFFVSGA
jgi:predicted nuclease of predicted toxin-antitoxin system